MPYPGSVAIGLVFGLAHRLDTVDGMQVRVVIVAQPAHFVVEDLPQRRHAVAHGKHLVDLLLVLHDGEMHAGMVEHIGHFLCHGIGIRTWADLAATEVSLLRTMLDDAGARLKNSDPSTWPQQAGLLATRDWTGFAALRDRLNEPSDAPS